MKKVKISTNVTPYPMPVTLVGANVGGRPNFLAVAWIARVNNKPPIVVMGLNKRHYTLEGIKENKTLSVNLPGAELIEKTDYCGMVSGREVDKSNLFEVFYGDLETAPMIQECPLCLECRLFDIVELPSNSMVLGEVAAVYTDGRYLTEGKTDMRKINPVMLTMPDAGYLTLGDRIAKAWEVGKRLKQGG